MLARGRSEGPGQQLIDVRGREAGGDGFERGLYANIKLISWWCRRIAYGLPEPPNLEKLEP